MVAMPSGSNSTSGRKAVAATGIASVAHQIDIHRPTAATRQAIGSIACCQDSSPSIRANTAGPSTRPTRW